jgi:hypothetical protein
MEEEQKKKSHSEKLPQAGLPIYDCHIGDRKWKEYFVQKRFM